MEYQEIITRIDLATNNLKQYNMIKDFPNVINDLYYIYHTLEEDTSKLNEMELFLHGDDIQTKVIEYFSVLTTKYIKHRYNTDIEIELSHGYNMTSISAGAFDVKERKIKYSPFGLSLNKINNSSYLETFLHESRHKMQHDAYLANNINEILASPSNIIILAKEYAYGTIQNNNTGNFYMENYSSLYTETDAEVFSKSTVKIMLSELYLEYNNYMKKNNLPRNEELETKIRLLKKEMLENISAIEEKQKSMGRLRPDIINETYGYHLMTSKYMLNGNEIDRLIELDKYIKNHPEIQESMPIFKLIFNGDIPKTYTEIIIDKQRLLVAYPSYKNKIEELYKNIIKSDPILYLTYLVETNQTDLIINFINDHNTILIEYQQEINEIIEKYNQQEAVQTLIYYAKKRKNNSK